MYIETEPSHFDVLFDKLAEKLDDVRRENKVTPKYTKDQESFWSFTLEKYGSVVTALFGCRPNYFWKKKYRDGNNANGKKSIDCKVLIKALQHFGPTFSEDFITNGNEKRVAEELWTQFITENEHSKPNDSDSNDTVRHHRNNKVKFLEIVPRRIDTFIGRIEEQEQVREALSETKKIVFLHGVPGIGKTSLVKTFIDQYKNHFDHIAWVSMDRAIDEIQKEKADESEYRLEQAFQPLYRFLNPEKQHNDGMNIQQRFFDTIAQLNHQDGNNLLIVDNCDSSILKLQGILHWKILATGRYKVSGTSDVSLLALNEKESIELFKKFCDRVVDEDLLKEFLQEIDRHTLMVEVAAKTLNESPWLTLEDLYERLLTGQLKDQELDQEVTTEYAAEKKLIDQLMLLFDIKSLSEEEAAILKTWYYLRPNSYTAQDISNFTDISLQDGHLKSLLSRLSKNGWIEHDTKDRRYSLHRLIQKTILYALPPILDDVKSLLDFIHRSLNDVLTPKAFFPLRTACDYLISQVCYNDQTNILLAFLCSKLAEKCMGLDMLEKATIYLEHCLTIFRLHRKTNDIFREEFEETLIELSMALMLQTDFEAAEKLLLEINELPQHPHNITIFQILINIYIKLNRKESAREYSEKLIELLILNGKGENDRDIRRIMLNMLLYSDKDYEKAWLIGNELFEEYKLEYEAGRMALTTFAEGAETHTDLLIGLKRMDEAIDVLESLILIIEKSLSIEPSDLDVSMRSLLVKLREIYEEKGSIQEWENASMMLWDQYWHTLYFRPESSRFMIEIAIELAKKIIPEPDYLRSCLRQSFIYGIISQIDIKYYRERLIDIKHILNWSEEDLEEFEKEINIKLVELRIE